MGHAEIRGDTHGGAAREVHLYFFHVTNRSCWDMKIGNGWSLDLAHDLCMSEEREDISRKSCRFDFALNLYPICYVQILISLEINWLIWARIGINMNVNHQTWCVFMVE